MGRTSCTEPHCLYKGALYLITFLPDQSQAVTSGSVTAKARFQFQATSCDTGMGFPVSTVVIIIPLALHAISFYCGHYHSTGAPCQSVPSHLHYIILAIVSNIEWHT